MRITHSTIPKKNFRKLLYLLHMITIDIPVEILFIISERKQKIVEEKFVFIAELAPREVAAMINSNFTKPVQQKYKWSLISKQELQILLKPIRGDAYEYENYMFVFNTYDNNFKNFL